MIKTAPFGHASTSRTLEEAALDDEWPGPPDKDYLQTSILDFARRPLKPKRKRRAKTASTNVVYEKLAPPSKTLEKRALRSDRKVKLLIGKKNAARRNGPPCRAQNSDSRAPQGRPTVRPLCQGIRTSSIT